MTGCPCGFGHSAEMRTYSAEWHKAHEAAHLAAFPDVDERTREVLREATERAAREQA